MTYAVRLDGQVIQACGSARDAIVALTHWRRNGVPAASAWLFDGAWKRLA
jgi:hypothetical protein